MGLGDRRTAARIGTVADARRLARRRLPAVVFDYIDGAAEAELTMGANRADLDAVTFLPAMAAPGSRPGADLRTTVLGTELAFPVIVGPVGFTRSMDPAGDVAGARAAHAAGTLFTHSTMSGHTMAEVAAAAPGRAWFQLYGLGGRTGVEQLLARAADAGYRALVVTVDTPIPGNRERDLRHRVSLPLRLDRRTVLRFAPDAALHPRWVADLARDRFTMHLALAEGLGDPAAPMSSDEALVHWVLNPVTWDDFAWLRPAWPGPVLAKGVLTADDARRALDAGADALVVSNHGGRQLDSVPSSVSALRAVVAAVGDRTEVLVDGGVRRGSDAVKLLALGARAVLVGRAWAYALGAAGEPGVAAVLGILRAEVDRTLRLLGVASVAELGPHLVSVPGPAPR